ncbi:MAG: hypothetical protein AAGD10_12355 [Myxococcota bacterium]
MKLVTLGDSISQGFQSLAAARQDLSYSAFVAEQLQVPPAHYRMQSEWHEHGLPLDMEYLLRDLEKRFGNNIRGPIVWPLILNCIREIVNQSESHWERGKGKVAAKYPGNIKSFHNLSTFGHRVADAWILNAKLCRKLIAANPRSKKDNFFGLPSHASLRAVNRTLNPGQDPTAYGLFGPRLGRALRPAWRRRAVGRERELARVARQQQRPGHCLANGRCTDFELERRAAA